MRISLSKFRSLGRHGAGAGVAPLGWGVGLGVLAAAVERRPVVLGGHEDGVAVVDERWKVALVDEEVDPVLQVAGDAGRRAEVWAGAAVVREVEAGRGVDAAVDREERSGDIVLAADLGRSLAESTLHDVEIDRCQGLPDLDLVCHGRLNRSIERRP